jgi:putative OPT family oligopeptide transporter
LVERTSSKASFQPFIPAGTLMPEFTLRAVILGIFFGLVFGAATVYLALRAGLTVSASIPIAVLAISVFKRFGRSTILENNIVQTVGSAGESVAAGVVFTFPALLFLTGGEDYFTYINFFTLAIIGGTIGVLFMVPLRRALIVKEHGNLPYPEGTACADVLIAGEKGGSMAKHVFSALGIAVAYKSLMSIFGLWKDTPGFAMGRNGLLPNASIAAEITPEYLGVGYIIGLRGSTILVAGGFLSYLVLIPLITIFGDSLPAVFKAGSTLISDMTPGDIRGGYVRFIGAGAVAAGGLITLIKTLPTIFSAFRDSFKSLREKSDGKASLRTERDLPITFVIVGAIALVLIIALLPQLPGTFPGSLLAGLLIVVFGFFFVTVSSRIVGIIGCSNNPISGMTIGTIMAVSLIFVTLGLTSASYQALALIVGSMVCIAAANAGATSQDLKTGYIVGATPLYQQLSVLIGVISASFAIGVTLMLIDGSMAFQGIEHAIGTDKYSAPQANLMATIIKGVLARDLPWSLVGIGFGISIIVELLGISSLSFAVGVYLPLSTTLPIFIGGAVKGIVDRIQHKKEESEVSPGMLYSTGLVAGGSLTGVAIAVLSGIVVTDWAIGKEVSLMTYVQNKVGVLGWEQFGIFADIIGVAMFAILATLLFRRALRSNE